METIALSVLDTIPIGPGADTATALQGTLALARCAEALDCRRYWVVEHHAVPDIGCSAPAVILAWLAARTSTIRLGSGGVMLPNHAPLVVAEQFTTLQALYPGRIDLGVGRASGTGAVTAHALRRQSEHATPEGFEAQVEELLHFMHGSFPADHPYQGVGITLRAQPTPFYLLGASVGAARAAASRGMLYAHAHHINPNETMAAVAAYRREFVVKGPIELPYVFATCNVVCADTDAEAQERALRASLLRLRVLGAAQAGRALLPQEADLATATADELALARQLLDKNRVVVGSGERVAGILHGVAAKAGLDEIMLTFIQYDTQERLQTLRCLAQAFAAEAGRGREDVVRA